MTDETVPARVNPAIVAILLAQAKHHGTTFDAQVERFLRAGLSAERQRLVAARRTTPTAAAVPIEDPCSEPYLRRYCGDDWELCWWASTCSIFG